VNKSLLDTDILSEVGIGINQKEIDGRLSAGEAVELHLLQRDACPSPQGRSVALGRGASAPSGVAG
jgi:hypothetical protein